MSRVCVFVSREVSPGGGRWKGGLARRDVCVQGCFAPPHHEIEDDNDYTEHRILVNRQTNRQTLT